MPSGKSHTKINFFLWIIILITFIKFHTSLEFLYPIGSYDNYIFTPYQAALWFSLFSLDFYIHTITLNPDVDTDSDARRRLGILGWIIDKLFKHRGTLHKMRYWALLFIPLCVFVGSWFIGGFLAVVAHIVSDKIVTGVKRVV